MTKPWVANIENPPSGMITAWFFAPILAWMFDIRFVMGERRFSNLDTFAIQRSSVLQHDEWVGKNGIIYLTVHRYAFQHDHLPQSL
jgi:hypothetical protein